MTARPKFAYVRSRTLLAAVRKLACQCCGATAPSDPAHSNQAAHGKGKSIKASDVYVAAMCRVCHRMIDQGSFLSESERVVIWTTAWRATVRALLRLGWWPPEVEIPDIRVMT